VERYKINMDRQNYIARTGFFILLALIFISILVFSYHNMESEKKWRHERTLRLFKSDSLDIEGEYNTIKSFYINHQQILEDINYKLKLLERKEIVSKYSIKMIEDNKKIRDYRMKELINNYKESQDK
jgi:hypothetical protein